MRGAGALAAEDEVVTLDQALREAAAANARLPMPALDIQIADEHIKEARAERWLKAAVEGDFIYAPYYPPGYSPAITNLGEARLQAVIRQPLYSGGALDAAVTRADANKDAARAHYRIAEKDLELEVRSRYAELLEARAEAEIRRGGIAELEQYVATVRNRQAAGQGVSADVLKTEVRRSLEQLALAETEQRADDARLGLNDLMGRDPTRPLRIAEQSDPSTPSPADADAWTRAPEVAAAEASARVAEADRLAAAAERRLKLGFAADAGWLTDDTMHLNSDFWNRLWRNGGYSLSLLLTFPIWDAGAAKARIAQANYGAKQAQLKLESDKREARLTFEKARSALAHLFDQFETLSRVVPSATDSYLESESRYRGGTATSLEVLDSHAAALDASVRRTDVIARYRIAEALLRRWSTP